ncbi:MAG: hypothetical protein PHY47_25495 [Lachnospiraceae bacterium]|nr:hypothetical protein [Lachnospiraceae bacterium]
MNKKDTIIYITITCIIAFLLLLNATDNRYKMFKNETLLTEGKTAETHRLALPKGNYKLVMNCKCSTDIPMTVFIDLDHKIKDVLKANREPVYYVLNFEVKENTDLFHFTFDNYKTSKFELYNYELWTDTTFYNDAIYDFAIFIIFSILLYILLYFNVFQNAPKENKKSFLVLLGLIIFTSYPLFTDYLIYGHDLAVHLMRIEGLKDAILDKQFPAMIYPNSNNGFGVLGFVYPNLFLLFSAGLRLCNVSMVTSYQSLLIMINIATAAVTYYSAKTITKSNDAALMACIIYMLSPYRLNDLYIRASLGEVIAMIFLPIVIAGIYHIFLGDKKKWYLLVIGYSGVVQSHMLSCIFVTMISVIMGILLFKHLLMEKRIFALAKAITAFLIINGWYIIPVYIFTKSAVGLNRIQNTDFYEDAVFPGQLLMTKASTFTTLSVGDGIGQEMQLSIGIMCGIVLLLGVFYLLHNRKQEQKAEKIVHLLMVSLMVLCGVMLFASTTIFPWKALSKIAFISKLMSTIQFPFRFLSIVTVSLALICGLVIENTDMLRKYKKELMVVLIIVGMVGAYEIMDGYLQEEVYITKTSGGFTEFELSEYWPDGTKSETFEDTSYWVSGAEITYYQKEGTKLEFFYDAAQEGAFIQLPLLYYPGYRAKLSDGETLKVVRGEENRVCVALNESKNKQKVTVYYSFYGN